MKKLINKILKKQDKTPLGRITSDTVADHREQILSSGRRFKYPIQYSRHKLVINAVVISFIALSLVVLFGWWRLYVAQDTGEFIYRVTRVLPVSVAKIDDQPVAYSDYLMSFRSSVHYSRQKEQLNEKTEDGQKIIEYYKKQSIDGAIANAYAKKIAKDLGLSISEKELDDYIKEQRQSSDGEISQQTFDASTLEFLGLNPAEYRHRIAMVLLKNKVALRIDEKADKLAKEVLGMALETTDLQKVRDSFIEESKNGLIRHGSSGWVSRFNQDGGLAMAAAKLDKGSVGNQLIESSRGDGYYVIKLVDLNDDQVNYEYININLSEFNNRLKAVTDSKDSLKTYIKI